MSRIQDIIRNIETENGGAVINEPLSKHSAIRFHLGQLAVAYEVGNYAACTDKDLISLYSVARKNEESAKRIAARLNDKYDNKPPVFTKPLVTHQAPNADLSDILDRLDRQSVALAGLELDLKGLADTANSAYTDAMKAGAEAGEQAAQAILDSFKANEPTRLVIQFPNQAPVPVGLVHRKTATIIQFVTAGNNVYLHGPAGSGKTTVARVVADTLGVQFYCAAKVESEYLLLGFKDARGETVRTQFREAFEHGGLFLFDELDASSPAAVVALNMALANGECPFPDGIIKRHADFYCIAAGNTKLTGANRQYAGRMQLDAASIDRFAFIEFDYDEALEMALATNQGWCLHVQSVRDAIRERGLPHLVTPRATIEGCKLLEAGVAWDDVEQAWLWKGLDSDTVEQLRNATSFVASNAANRG